MRHFVAAWLPLSQVRAHVQVESLTSAGNAAEGSRRCSSALRPDHPGHHMPAHPPTASRAALQPAPAGVGMRARAGYIYIRGEFVNERKAVMRAIGAWLRSTAFVLGFGWHSC